MPWDKARCTMERNVGKQGCESRRNMKKQACWSWKQVWSQKKEKWVPCESPEVEKHIEVEMIRCFKLVLYIKVEQKSSSLKILYLPLCIYLSCPSTLSFTPLFNVFHNKRKKKRSR